MRDFFNFCWGKKMKLEETDQTDQIHETDHETQEENQEESDQELDQEFNQELDQEINQQEEKINIQESSLLKKKKSFAVLWKENKKRTIKKVYDRRDIIRGPRTAWLYFLQASRNGESYSKLCKKLSVIWKGLSNEQKEPYYQKERKDVERYKREESLLNERDRKILKKIRKRRRQEKAENFPKRPLSAYQLFLKDYRPKIKEKNPEFTFSQIGKELGKQWKEINIEEKKQYSEIATIESERYKREKQIHLTEYGFIYRDSPYTCKNAKETRNEKVPM